MACPELDLQIGNLAEGPALSLPKGGHG